MNKSYVIIQTHKIKYSLSICNFVELKIKTLNKENRLLFYKILEEIKVHNLKNKIIVDIDLNNETFDFGNHINQKEVLLQIEDVQINIDTQFSEIRKFKINFDNEKQKIN